MVVGLPPVLTSIEALKRSIAFLRAGDLIKAAKFARIAAKLSESEMATQKATRSLSSPLGEGVRDGKRF
jgi:hypothetical protein